MILLKLGMCLGKKTKLTTAVAKSASLRTTVPMSVVKQFDLKLGDELDWAFEVIDGKMAIVVRPIKATSFLREGSS
jgi:bifunctional DNA-binding transcriptional regulator/antitoxin component of YhaV-PrlF toxin-antitoxin module